MHHKFLSTGFFFALIFITTARAAAPALTPTSISASSLTFKFTMHASNGAPVLFAFSSLPGIGFSLAATVDGAPRSVTAGKAGWMGRYYLQWISLDGDALIDKGKSTSGMEGSVTVSLWQPLWRGVTLSQIKLMGSAALVPVAAALRKTVAAAQVPATPFSVGLKIEINADGIYELTPGALAAAGVPVASIPSRRYRLYEQDHEIPLYCTAASSLSPLVSDDRILFYGRFLRGNNPVSGSIYTQFSNTNAYWLTWSDTAVGLRMALVSGAQRVDPTRYSRDSVDLYAHDFFDTLHLEEDNDIRWLGDPSLPQEMIEGVPSDSAIDNWYWGFVGDEELTTFPITIPSPSRGGTARLRIGLMGLTASETDPVDHQVSVLINNMPAGGNNSALWDGQRPYIFTSDTFSAATLVPTAGQSQLNLLVKRRSYEDRSALNWIELYYPRTYRATDDKLLFKSPDNGVGQIVQFELAGFSSQSIDLWDLRMQRVFSGFTTKAGTGADRGKRTVVVQDSVPSSTAYLAQSSALRLKPGSMRLDTIRTDWSNLSGVDYIAISTDTMRATLQPLLDLHERGGLHAAFVDIDKIYDAFSCGVKNPESIRSFLNYCFALSPDRPPRFLLLAGDCTHDLYKKNIARTVVPTHLSRIPNWGPAASDDYFACVKGDDEFADLSVGRFPAESPAQMKAIVDKTINYIRSPERGFWRDNLLLASGYEHEFTAFTNTISTDAVGDRMNLLRMDADPQSQFYKDEFGASTAMAGFINAGVLALNFCGHGGGNVWSDSRFFGSGPSGDPSSGIANDIAKLHNGSWGVAGRLPVVFSLTCLTGFFESAFYRSLGEEFVRANRDGAIAFYGASALTTKQGNFLLDRIIMDNAFSGNFTTIGELLQYCEMNLLVQYGTAYLPLVRQYNLLGDPALPWTLTPDTLHCVLAKSALSAGDSLLVSGGCAPVRHGSVSLLVEAGNAVWNRTVLQTNNGTFAKSFSLKDSAKTASGMVRAYAWNDSTEVRGRIGFTKDTIAVGDVRIAPDRFGFGDSVSVSCAIILPGPGASDAVFCLYALAAPNDPTPAYTGVRMERDSTDRWVTAVKIPLPFTGDVNKMLRLYFRTIAGSISKESDPRSFPIAGNPDLSFANNTLPVVWRGDSLRIAMQVINKGSAVAPPFSVTVYRGDAKGSDSIAVVNLTDSLAPGRSWDASCALPDTQGAVRYTAVINAGLAFPEVALDNNSAGGSIDVAYRDCNGVADTLFSRLGGCAVSPARPLAKPSRIFLFAKRLPPAARPLATESRFLPLGSDSLAAFSIGCRPALAAGDSLDWRFIADSLPPEFNAGAASTPSGKLAVMIDDSLLAAWRYTGGVRSFPGYCVLVRSRDNGPFALSWLRDVAPPAVQVSVYGRTLKFLDYAAKDKPFDILFTDPSGIDPSSVAILLNRKPLGDDRRSRIGKNGDLNNLTVTAYPAPDRPIDTLSVIASDLAGNEVRQNYAFMPGENFDIKFLSCHPNPFSLRSRGVNGVPQTVRFALLLTDKPDEIALSIYTVTGKKIATLPALPTIGYQEVPWDGRDNDGYRIANGTYYAKLTARQGNKSLKKIIRIAKLEGY
jgi:hypothetical protein